MNAPEWVHEIESGGVCPAADRLQALLQDHPLVIVRSLPLRPADLLNLARQFGEPLEKAGVSPVVHLLPNVENTDRRKTFLSTSAMEWHSDRSFDPETPAWSFLHAESIGKGAGQTIWANTHLAYENLDADLKRECLGLKSLHSLSHFSKTYEDEIYGFNSNERQKLVFERCQTLKNLIESWNGKRYLNINRGYTSEIPGKECDFLERLLAHCENERHTYTHHWKTNDLAISNNRILIHARRKSESDERTMHRVLIV